MADWVLSETAKEGLIRIHRYGIRTFGMKRADAYFHALIEMFDVIASTPFSFEAVDAIKPGYRRCVCGADSIYYRVAKHRIEIMAIVGRQDLSHWYQLD